MPVGHADGPISYHAAACPSRGGQWRGLVSHSGVKAEVLLGAAVGESANSKHIHIHIHIYIYIHIDTYKYIYMYIYYIYICRYRYRYTVISIP